MDFGTSSSGEAHEREPLLHRAKRRHVRLLHPFGGAADSDDDHEDPSSPQGRDRHPRPSELEATLRRGRRTLRRFLTSRAGHYAILALVSLDVSCIFADFIVTIFTCQNPNPPAASEEALDALGIISLVFSCLFMVELLASVWAFGLSYFKSKFHLFDGAIITSSFIIDILLRGPLEEVASLIIILRLWRVVKIIEELSVGAEEQMENLQERVQELEKDNNRLREELEHTRGRAS